VERAGLFDTQRALDNDIPMKYWNRLQKGETIDLSDRVLTPDMVLGPQRQGLKVTYATDTRPTKSLHIFAKEADLLILEGMYGDPTHVTKAKDRKHMMMQEAAKIALSAQAKELWLTHYSPSLMNPISFMKSVRKIFTNANAAMDGDSKSLLFED
jgi:ribonuclease Z